MSDALRALVDVLTAAKKYDEFAEFLALQGKEKVVIPTTNEKGEPLDEKAQYKVLAKIVDTVRAHFPVEPFDNGGRTHAVIAVKEFKDRFLTVSDLYSGDAALVSKVEWMLVSKIRPPTDKLWRLPKDPRRVEVGDLYADVLAAYKAFFVVRDERVYHILTTWTLFTWVLPMVAFNPRLYLIGATGGGKSLIILLLTHLAYRPIPSDASTEPAVRRDMDRFSGTVLYDEFSNLSKEKKAFLWEVIPTGFNKGATVRRVKMDGSGDTEGFDVGDSSLVIGSRFPFKQPDIINKGVTVACLGVMADELKGILCGLEYADNEQSFVSLPVQLVKWFEEMRELRTRALRWRLELLSGRREPVKVKKPESAELTRRLANVTEALAPIPLQFGHEEAVAAIVSFMRDQSAAITSERESDLEGLIVRSIEFLGGHKSRTWADKDGKEWICLPTSAITQGVWILHTGGNFSDDYLKSHEFFNRTLDGGFARDYDEAVNEDKIGRCLSRVMGFKTGFLPRASTKNTRLRGIQIAKDEFDAILDRLRFTQIGKQEAEMCSAHSTVPIVKGVCTECKTEGGRK